MSCNQTAKKSNWRTVRLGEICNFNSASYSTKDKWSYVNYLDTGNIISNTISEIQRIILSKDKLPSRAKRKVRKNDIIFSTVRPNQKHYGFINKEWDNLLVSTGFVVISPIEKLSYGRYIYYFLSQNKIIDKLHAIAEQSTSTYPSIKPSDIEDLKIPLPPLEEQEAIAGVLSSLDDKIELNNKINQNLDWEDYFSICHRISELEEENQNLEAQAQAIFKSWFVDFEPFKNGKFIDSELGKIPEGWNVNCLGNVCNCELGGTPNRTKPEYWNGNIPWINSGKVNEFRIISESEFITELGLKKSSTKLLPRKTTVFAITGATLGQVSLLEIESCANQSVVGVIENASMPYEYIYQFALFNIKELISHQTGGAQQHINKENIESLKIILPDTDILIDYKKLVAPLYSQITNNVFESQRIAQLRDALLPKLMSGEIDVSEVVV